MVSYGLLYQLDEILQDLDENNMFSSINVLFCGFYFQKLFGICYNVIKVSMGEILHH